MRIVIHYFPKLRDKLAKTFFSRTQIVVSFLHIIELSKAIMAASWPLNWILPIGAFVDFGLIQHLSLIFQYLPKLSYVPWSRLSRRILPPLLDSSTSAVSLLAIGFTSRIEEGSTLQPCHINTQTKTYDPSIEQSLDKNSSPYAALTRRLGEHGTATDQSSSHDHANTIPWKPIATQTGNSIQLLPNSADVISFIKGNTKKKKVLSHPWYRTRIRESR